MTKPFISHEYECPDCHRQMAVVFVGDGTAYDECECGTVTEPYPVIYYPDA